MDLHCRVNRPIAYLYSILLITVAGCSEAVMMSQETEQGGVVTYVYKQDRGGHMGSPYRRQALDVIQGKCGTGARILREGEVRGYTSAGMGTIEGTEDEERGRRWGIRFECRGSGEESKPAEMSQPQQMRRP